MPIQALVSRLAEAKLREALEDTPVFLLHGPRQSGKTTLAKKVGDELGRTYISFDDTVHGTSIVASGWSKRQRFISATLV